MKAFVQTIYVAFLLNLAFPGDMGFAGAPTQPPQTRYLLVGGGSTPFNSQVSLEEHLARVRSLLTSRKILESLHSLLFVDGTTHNPTIELNDASRPTVSLLDELAIIADSTSDRYVTWRPTLMAPPFLPATQSQLKVQLETATPATRTVFYFAGHGYETKSGVSFGLWNNERVTPREFSTMLDPLPPDHQVTLIMAQCHAGGFWELANNDARSIKRGERYRPKLCGFFAAPADRVASGCTSAANRTNPDDFSTWFFSAIGGSIPSGAALPADPDFNHDGRIGLDEAQAFARIFDKTLDLPLSTSDLYLADLAPKLSGRSGSSLDQPINTLLLNASPADKAVVQALLQEHQFADTLSANDIGIQLNGRKEGQDKLEEQIDALEQQRESARSRSEAELNARWPWLANAYHPRFTSTLERENAAILEFIRNSSDHFQMENLDKQLGTLRGRRSTLEIELAHLERLHRLLLRISTEIKLRQSGSSEKIAHLDQLMQCEQESF